MKESDWQSYFYRIRLTARIKSKFRDCEIFTPESYLRWRDEYLEIIKNGDELTKLYFEENKHDRK